MSEPTVGGGRQDTRSSDHHKNQPPVGSNSGAGSQAGSLLPWQPGSRDIEHISSVPACWQPSIDHGFS